MSKQDDFVDYAESLCGDTGSNYQSMFGLSGNSSWSAAFVSTVSKRTGLLNTLMPKTTKSQDIADLGASEQYVSNPGTWVSGPAQGSDKVVPKVGDIMLISWGASGTDRANQVGIVRSVDDDTNAVTIIIGDYRQAGENRSKVCMTTFDSTNKCIKGYFRPDWDSVNTIYEEASDMGRGV